MRTIKRMNIKKHGFLLAVVVGILSQGCQAFSTEQAYDQTPVGTVEIKSLPDSRILVTKGEGRYFDRADNLFMRLFNYIKENDVAMTVPVEARMDKAGMTFYVGGEDSKKDLKDSELVKVTDRSGQDVVSLGVRGSYTEENFEEARKELQKWLLQQKRYESIGDPYAVFWNGPFVPGFMKRFEVHIPVKEAGERNEEASAEVARK